MILISTATTSISSAYCIVGREHKMTMGEDKSVYLYLVLNNALSYPPLPLHNNANVYQL
jgi:hypothetical protein